MGLWHLPSRDIARPAPGVSRGGSAPLTTHLREPHPPPADEGIAHMAIADLATTKHQPADKGPDCTVCQALLELPEADAHGLRAMLADKRRRFTEIAALIAADPDTPDWVRAIKHGTYRRHARGQCAASEVLR